MVKERRIPKRGGLGKRTIRELQMLGIQLNDLFEKEGFSIKLGWDKVIKLINYNADAVVLTWDTPFEEAVEIISDFLA